MDAPFLLAALAGEILATSPKPLPGWARDPQKKICLPSLSDRKRVVLCLDEAQAMPVETLEALRLLTNLEIERRKLMQVVLFGQPELNDKLSDPSIRQLKQSITFSYNLRPMNQDEVNTMLHTV